MVEEAFDLVQRRRQARMEDIEFLEKLVRDDIFDWEERYNHKYLLARARDIEMNASRLQKAVDTLDERQRIVKNKLRRFKNRKRS